MAFGFSRERDDAGQTVGWAVLQLARRGAFEVLGLRRPAFRPLPRLRGNGTWIGVRPI